tara:strand:- start:109 stop:720 length:612 start_codon:yes stop_codon:yes gene_type:complete
MKHIDFPNYGFIFDEMPDSVLRKVRSLCSAAKDFGKSQNDKLAGQLEEEWYINPKLIDSEVREYILQSVRDYNERWNYLDSMRVNTSDRVIDIGNMWVNYQKKTEFNPMHYHDGVFSFVMWIDIPFSYEEEAEVPLAKKSNKAQCGKFQFHYINMLGGITNHAVEAKEGDFALFPAGLNHSVSPFYTSDGYRISVSGNLYYIT